MVKIAPGAPSGQGLVKRPRLAAGVGLADHGRGGHRRGSRLMSAHVHALCQPVLVTGLT